MCSKTEKIGEQKVVLSANIRIRVVISENKNFKFFVGELCDREKESVIYGRVNDSNSKEASCKKISFFFNLSASFL